ncbi:MAG: alanyl-tRNA editing protein [Clostridia bacterium]|nr:alanyl-tRNA editing protein [Clostridia bacterium]MBQ2237244.1 alanyl-tRNA editing protein [Clostridia bacterium]MEE1185169.1 alanyl-tRNA editing protein [Acutalibacteraceae bacterium]
MTQKLYENNSHIRDFCATVISCSESEAGYHIILDKTAFFPEGGGQASDKGTIGEAQITDVQTVEGEIIHFSDKPLVEGEEYECHIDWNRRFRYMQNHSGEHIICGLINKYFGFDNVGFHLGEDEVTMDINGILNREQLRMIENLANEAVYKNAKFSVLYPTAQELPDMEYRSKLDITEDVRIVTVEGYDACACCAPHVDSAGEIGIIKILDFFRMRDGIRIYIKCGFDALEDYEGRYMSTKLIADLLSAKQYEVSDAVEKLIGSIAEQKHINSELKKRLIEAKISVFGTKEEKTAVFEEGLDVKELQLYADGLYKLCGGIRGVFSKMADTNYNFAICGDATQLDKFFAEFKTKLNVRGGGRNGMVQGSVQNKREEISGVFL